MDNIQDELEYAETLEAIKQGLEQAERGELKPASQVLAELEAKYDLSR
jgi:predicted transcriptional regulator